MASQPNNALPSRTFSSLNGKVIDGKYKIIKEIGRGGTSLVYLAKDLRLRKMWAIKAFKKAGGRQGEIAKSSVYAEINFMKRLDYPTFPRIVDIITEKEVVYIVMDYIEGISLLRMVSTLGPQDEDRVIEWGRQLAHALDYLHSLSSPVIYRDLKPANVIITPSGNVKIIDFGTAAIFKKGYPDEIALGTMGFAAPEQYKGRSEPASDIYCLGKTLYFALSGVIPKSTKRLKPLRKINPKLSAGIEQIIKKCTEQAASNRYSDCRELLRDLESPSRTAVKFKHGRRIKKVAVVLTVLILSCSLVLTAFAKKDEANRKYSTYEEKLKAGNPESYYEAVSIFPDRIEAYKLLIEYGINQGFENDEIIKIGNTIQNNLSSQDIENPEVQKLIYTMGRFYFSAYEGSMKEKAIGALPFFKSACEGCEFEKKEIAECYLEVCNLLLVQNKASEATLSDFSDVFSEINRVLDILKSADDNESNYDKITFYYIVSDFINFEADSLASVGFSKSEVIQVLDEIYSEAESISSALSYVNRLKDAISDNYASFLTNLYAQYNEVEKRSKNA